jgi:hypothetical protein
VLIDFGIAQAADDQRLTQTGLVIGTPGYLAPELIEGELVSESADWWGWAATVTFAATGRRPFGKGPFEAVLHRVHTGHADLEGLDPRLKPLLAAALSPDKRDRPTQDEIMTGLSRYAEGRDALPPRETPTVAAVPATVELNPPTALMTQQMPADSPSPTEVAQLVPAVIPPLSAFSPLVDKLAKKQPVAAAPVHPAIYSPAPNAAAPAAMPLPYQTGPMAYPGTYEGPPPYQGPTPYQQPAQPEKPPKAPPTGRRTLVIVGFMVALTGLVALYPGLGSLVAIVLFVIARTVDRSSTALMRRRQMRGRSGRSDGVVAAASTPLQLITAALISLPCLILPFIVAGIVGASVTAMVATTQGLDWQPLSAVGFGSAALSGLFSAWWGPGGSSVRRGAHIAARNVLRPQWLSALVAVVLLAVGGLMFYKATQGEGSAWARTPIQTPTIDRPSLGDLRDAPFIRDLPIIGR